mmetsp:Transcript_25851/g.77007  ORF Transcript_25851/g.77007 Transcript_25851/m.77007 type:complete len:305 (-) Transcript_25851:185-1099(-)
MILAHPVLALLGRDPEETRPALGRRLQPGEVQGRGGVRAAVGVLREELGDAPPRARGGGVPRAIPRADRPEGGLPLRVADQRLEHAGVTVVEGVGAVEGEVEHHPGRPDVDLGPVVVDPDLRGTVVGRPTDQLFQGHLLLSADAEDAGGLLDAHREAEVDELDVPLAALGRVAGQEDVLSLHVAVHDAHVVQVPECLHELPAHGRHGALGHGHGRVAEGREELAPGEALHDEEEEAIPVEDVHELHDVRVLHALQNVRLLPRRDEGGCLGEHLRFGVDDLHSELPLVRLVHRPTETDLPEGAAA